jgi:leishmanolysin
MTSKQIALILLCFLAINAESHDHQLQQQSAERGSENIISHSCIHDQIIEERKRPGRQVYSVTPQIYGQSGISKPLHRKGRALLGISESSLQQKDVKQPIRIFLNYDAVGHSPDRDCRKVGDIVKVGVICDLVSSVECTSFCCITDISFLFFSFLSARGASSGFSSWHSLQSPWRSSTLW